MNLIRLPINNRITFLSLLFLFSCSDSDPLKTYLTSKFTERSNEFIEVIDPANIVVEKDTVLNTDQTKQFFSENLIEWNLNGLKQLRESYIGDSLWYYRDLKENEGYPPSKYLEKREASFNNARNRYLKALKEGFSDEWSEEYQELINNPPSYHKYNITISNQEGNERKFFPKYMVAIVRIGGVPPKEFGRDRYSQGDTVVYVLRKVSENMDPSRQWLGYYNGFEKEVGIIIK